MGSPSVRRRGVQLLELMVVLPIVGLVLTAVSLSVAATQQTLANVQLRTVEQATVARFAQQLREDVHRATALPVASGSALTVERLEGTVRYDVAEGRVVRRADTPAGSSRDTFDVPASDSPWNVAAERRLVRFAWNGGRGGNGIGREIMAAWPGREHGPNRTADTPDAEDEP